MHTARPGPKTETALSVLLSDLARAFAAVRRLAQINGPTLGQPVKSDDPPLKLTVWRSAKGNRDSQCLVSGGRLVVVPPLAQPPKKQPEVAGDISARIQAMHR